MRVSKKLHRDLKWCAANKDREYVLYSKDASAILDTIKLLEERLIHKNTGAYEGVRKMFQD